MKAFNLKKLDNAPLATANFYRSYPQSGVGLWVCESDDEEPAGLAYIGTYQGERVYRDLDQGEQWGNYHG